MNAPVVITTRAGLTATLYCADCLDVLPTLGKVDAVITDPPYGIDYECKSPGAIDYQKIEGDNKPFDPARFLDIAPFTILWGGNNFANRLPIGGWLVWDKRVSDAADRMLGSPFELAWCSRKTLFKIIRAQHGGAKNADARNGDVANCPRYHPTQKPVVVMEACIKIVAVAGLRVLDPFMGSGSTGIAALRQGCDFTGIEIDPEYFAIAESRIRAEAAQGKLF